MQVSGNLGFAAQSGAPSAGFSASYSRTGADFDSDGDGRDAADVPARARGGGAASGPNGSEPVLRTLSLSAKDATQISDALRFEYGFALDRLLSPGRLGFQPAMPAAYTVSDEEQVEFSYTSGIPRSDMFLA